MGDQELSVLSESVKSLERLFAERFSGLEVKLDIQLGTITKDIDNAFSLMRSMEERLRTVEHSTEKMELTNPGKFESLEESTGIVFFMACSGAACNGCFCHPARIFKIGGYMTGIESELDARLLQMIGAAAMETVGFIEVLKNFFCLKNKKIWAAVMIPLSLCFCAVYSYLPIWVTAGILAVCACQICYDTILQTFKKIVGKIGGADNPPQDRH